MSRIFPQSERLHRWDFQSNILEFEERGEWEYEREDDTHLIYISGSGVGVIKPTSDDNGCGALF